MKKNIKIDFCDFWKGFNKTNNGIINILKKHYNVEITDKPDFLFCSCFGGDFRNYNNCVKIFTTDENVIPNFNYYDYASGFDFIDFGDRYFRKLNGFLPREILDRSFITDDFANRKFCNFIYSNSTAGEGSQLRQDFCKRLMKYKHIDCPGRVLHNIDIPELENHKGNWVESKRALLKKYKFTIAFENSSSNGYTTEKLFDPFFATSVPVYFGNPIVAKDFNSKAFINANDFNNDFDAIIERIKFLDTRPHEYLKMLRESPVSKNYDFDIHDKFEAWLISIIEKGNKPFNKDPLAFSPRIYNKEWRTLRHQKRAIVALYCVVALLMVCMVLMVLC